MLPPWSKWFGEETMRELVPDDRLRAALEAEMPRLPFSYFDAIVPLPAGWEPHTCTNLLLSDEPYGESAAEARNRGWPVVEIPGAGHLAMGTAPKAVTDALLDLEEALVSSV